jgi:hypothetical protein
MTTNVETYRTSVAAAANKFPNDIGAAEAARQATVDAAGWTVGFRPGFPTGYATYAAAIAAANKQKGIDVGVAEAAKQGTVGTAKDLLRSQGELPF